jgi:hypothetical protein
MPARYWVGGTDVWNNVAGTKWSATSGGPGGASAPTSADDVFFDANSGSGTVTTATTAICLRVNFTGFTGTFNVATNWTVGADITFSTAMNITGAGGIIKNNSGGIYTFNGKVYPGGWFYPSGNGFATTIGDDLVFQGNLVGGINSNLNATSARTITVLGSLTWPSGVNLANVSFIMGGTGNLSGTFVRTSGILNTIVINTLGTITHNATLSLSSAGFSYVAGTWVSTSTLVITGTGGCSMSGVSGITFGALSFGASGGQSVVLNSDMYIDGNLVNSTVTSTINGPGKLFIRGNVTPTQPLSGTSTIELIGNSNTTISAGTILNNLTINKNLGVTVSLIGNLVWGANNNTLTLTSGIFSQGSNTLTISSGILANISGLFTFSNLTIPGSNTINILNLVTITGILNVGSNGNVSFTGSSGFTVSSFTCSTAGRVITLQSGRTYRIQNSLTLIGTLAQRITLATTETSTFVGTIIGNSLTLTSGMPPTIGMKVSQTSGQIPTGLANLLPNRPTIIGGTSPNFTIDLNVSPSINPAISLRAGNPAFFILENGATQNVLYTTTQDIDSSGGQTIYSGQSFNDNPDVVSPNLFRTINWGTLEPPAPQTIGFISIR